MKRRFIARFAGLLAAGAVLAASGLIGAQAGAADAVFPLGSRLGLTPPPGMTASAVFPGFEDRVNSAYIRLVALPDKAFAEIEKTMTNAALKKQGMTVEKREKFTLPNAKGLLIVAQQEADAVRLRKWMLFVPIADVTALVSFEMPANTASRYPDAAIRAALASTTARATVPVPEQLELLPFRLEDLAGLRVARVMPGVAVQLTDGAQDHFDSAAQSHLVVSIARGSPPEPRDRDSFARLALSGLPPLNDVRITAAESMRLGGMPGHEMRAAGKDPKTGADVEIVQWLRFGAGGYVRMLGFGPKQGWTDTFMRFRAVRDGVQPR